MENLIRSWLVTSLVVTSAVTLSRGAAASDLRLTLVIYDHAHVGAETLADAENTAAAIFGRTGVQVVWREGFAYAAERRDVLSPLPEDPATLVVKLKPESEMARYGVRSVCGGIGFSSGVIIFVHKFDAERGVSDATRIGYVIAHEIGHVMLGPNAHAIVGIMRGTLLPDDWAQAAQGTLGFTRSQTRQIQTWMIKRTASTL